MHHSSRRMRGLLAALSILPGMQGLAHGAGFPDKPITLVVPYAPGATTDTIARRVGALMGKALGTTIVIENKPGANGVIGATTVARAAPNGYTMLLSTDSSSVLNPLLYTNLSYNPDKDLAPVALLSDLPLVLVVNSSLPVRDLKEFVAYAKAHPGEINYGSTGNGGTFHLAGELFSQQAGIRMTHVPYKGGAPAVAAMVGNEIQALFGVVGSNLSQIRAGKLRPIALAARERMPTLPDVPTFAESGYKDFVVQVRYGLSVPKAVPRPIVEQLAAAANKALADPEFRGTFIAQGFVPPASSDPAAYQSLIDSDRRVWTDLIRQKNISLDQ
ncbi:tripartite tricarboxylate transporter substrate binding protein [Cupriavidus pauculus]|uniref:Tripartite tricarboxylate transporter substrate binding protein n=1 Tax=Cupriavidus pauculus TaxID=82633 RepID=A0A5P2HFW3_9BURK|nr:tripartite tricarboxylate transporter substrate binding protein [Cupriavidus pauculus]QET06135.1 tripartite tricarboxylate transporter substrate binding protein [Cupriavidus pauculus]